MNEVGGGFMTFLSIQIVTQVICISSHVHIVVQCTSILIDIKKKIENFGNAVIFM